MLNFFVIAVMPTVGVLIIRNSLATNSLVGSTVRYANAAFYLILATLLIPATVTFVSSFRDGVDSELSVDTAWTDRPWSIPCRWRLYLFQQYCFGCLKELEEAVAIDSETDTDLPVGGSAQLLGCSVSRSGPLFP